MKGITDGASMEGGGFSSGTGVTLGGDVKGATSGASKGAEGVGKGAMSSTAIDDSSKQYYMAADEKLARMHNSQQSVTVNCRDLLCD